MKRVLSIILSLALIIGVMPTSALAADNSIVGAEATIQTNENSHWAEETVQKLATEGIISDELNEMVSSLDGQATRAQAVAVLFKSVKGEPDAEIENSLKFSDISGHWAEKYILAAVEAGYVNGYPDGTFRPDNTITRAEIAKITAIAMGLESETAENPFSDLSELD